jgi:hypothetical protein
MKWISGLLLICLVGCVSQEELALQRQYAAQRYQAQLAGQCSSFGFTPSTPEFAQCMLQLHQADEQRRANIAAAIIGSGMLNPRPQPAYQLPLPTPAKQPRQTNCYTDTLGYTRCTTY